MENQAAQHGVQEKSLSRGISKAMLALGVSTVALSLAGSYAEAQTVCTVSSADDSGAGTLRECIANGGELIGSSLSPGVSINLIDQIQIFSGRSVDIIGDISIDSTKTADSIFVINSENILRISENTNLYYEPGFFGGLLLSGLRVQGVNNTIEIGGQIEVAQGLNRPDAALDVTRAPGSLAPRGGHTIHLLEGGVIRARDGAHGIAESASLNDGQTAAPSTYIIDGEIEIIAPATNRASGLRTSLFSDGANIHVSGTGLITVLNGTGMNADGRNVNVTIDGFIQTLATDVSSPEAELLYGVLSRSAYSIINVSGSIETSGNRDSFGIGVSSFGFSGVEQGGILTVLDGASVTTHGPGSAGIFVSSPGYVVNFDAGSEVHTHGDGSYGLVLSSNGRSAQITVDGVITTSGDNAVGIGEDQWAASGAGGNNLIVGASGSLATTGGSSYAINLRTNDSGVRVAGQVASQNAEAILLEGERNRVILEPTYSILGNVVAIGADTVLAFGGAGSQVFDLSILGATGQFQGFAGLEKIDGSEWTLTGQSDFSGNTVVSDGRLTVDGNLQGASFEVQNGAVLDGSGVLGNVTVASGGRLSGAGTLGNVTVANAGIIAPGNSIGTLTVTGDLLLNQNSQLNYDLGAPGVAGSPGSSDLIAVGQNLTLDGQLHLFDDGGAGIGHYRLMTYGGTLTDNTLDVVTPGPVPSATYTVNAHGGNVDLVISSGGVDPIIGDPNLQYWQDASPTWTAAGEDWRNDGGQVDVAWAGNHGVFSGLGGTIDVVGAHSFRGLQFVSNGYLLGGTGQLQTVTGGSELRVLANETATLGVEITGSGGIDKTQNGTLILTGVNSYTGATSIGAGSLALQGVGSIASSVGLSFTGAGVFDVSGVASGATQIGTLSGVPGSEIRLGATDIAVAQASAGTYGGAITGAGGFALSGQGVLTLTGSASHTGLTSIETGSTLRVGDGGTSGSVAGAILNEGALVFDRSDAFTHAGVLTGAGDLFQRGLGKTTLSGASAAYAGAVGVEAGTLRIASGGVLGTSGLGIGTNGALGGAGIIAGNVTSTSGTIAPGMDVLGTLTVQGDVTFDGASTFAVRIAADGGNDLLAVTQAANVAGDVAVTALDAHTSYVDGQDYTILTAGGGVNGTFAGASMLNHSAFITPTLTHNADDVVLTIEVTADFTTVAKNFNQRQPAVALNDLEQSGDALAVFNTIAEMSEQQARRAFNLSSGEIHATGKHVLDQTFALFSRTLRHNGVAGVGAGNVGGQVFTATPMAYAQAPAAPGVTAIDGATTSAYADARVQSAWVVPLGSIGRVDGDGNAGRVDWWTGGIAGGYESALSPNAVAGLGFGYLRSRGTVDQRLSTLDSDGFYVGGYGAWAEGPWSVAGSLTYGANRISTKRNIAFMGRTAEATYWAHTVGLSGEVAYGFDVAPATRLAPLVTLDAGWSSHGGFTETGAGALNLTGSSESWTRLDTGLGFSLTHTIQTESGRVTLEGRALWEHAFADVVPTQGMTFAGSPTAFAVSGPHADRDRFRLGAGLAWEVSDDVTVRARYDGLFAGSRDTHTVSFGLNIRF